MKVIKNIEVPTGNILTVEGDRGMLELVSLGDYGKDVNIKCDSMGLGRIPKKVRHTGILPLSEKWVITVSTQYGCSMGCIFCDVPKVGPGKNATLEDLFMQFQTGMELHPEVIAGKRLNLHYARMGEPTWNPNVPKSAVLIANALEGAFGFHPVVSTMMPRHNEHLDEFIKSWMWVKNDFMRGEAGLQLSINSTNEDERKCMFNGNALTLAEISDVMQGVTPKGRKITLNFAIAGYEIYGKTLAHYFSPDHYICKLTPMHKTSAAKANGIKTDGDYTEYFPYEQAETELKSAGFDVLVFIASKEEDESGITCGNALLAYAKDSPRSGNVKEG